MEPEEQTKNSGSGWIFWVIIIVLIVSGSSKNSDNKPDYKVNNSTDSVVYPSYVDDTYSDSTEDIPEPENPYDEGSGHSAGYEWAQENNVSSCGGNSDSFIEGCEEYLSQQEEAQAQEDYENQ